MDRKNPFNIPAEGFQFILSMFSSLILKLKSPSGISFGLYFAYEEYRTDASNSLAERTNSPVESTVKMKTRTRMIHAAARNVSPAASTKIEELGIRSSVF